MTDPDPATTAAMQALAVHRWKSQGVVIEVPPQPWTATCPRCGMTRSLPDDWQQLLRDSLPKEDNEAWDGQMRCQNDHEPVVMTITVTPGSPAECTFCGSPLNRDGSCSRSCAGVGDG